MSLKGIFTGLAVSAVCTGLVLFIASLVMYFSTVPQEYLNIGMFVGTALSVMGGGIVCSKISGSKILLNCLCSVMLYLVFLIVCSIFKNGSIELNIRFFAVCIGAVMCSVLGAIICNR